MTQDQGGLKADAPHPVRVGESAPPGQPPHRPVRPDCFDPHQRAAARPPALSILARPARPTKNWSKDGDSEPVFAAPDEAAISAAKLRDDRYDFTFAEHALPDYRKSAVRADAPQIPHHGG